MQRTFQQHSSSRQQVGPTIAAHEEHVPLARVSPGLLSKTWIPQSRDDWGPTISTCIYTHISIYIYRDVHKDIHIDALQRRSRFHHWAEGTGATPGAQHRRDNSQPCEYDKKHIDIHVYIYLSRERQRERERERDRVLQTVSQGPRAAAA